MIERIVIVTGFVILVGIGTCLFHWLLNAGEWVDIYIRRNRPDLLKQRKARTGRRVAIKRALKRHRPVAKAVATRDRIIELLAKDKPQTAPIFIYIIMSSFLILCFAGLLVLGYLWGTI